MMVPDRKYRMVFSDIDGTLITSEHHLTQGTIDKVRALDRRQIPFVLVSARMPSGIYPLQRSLGISEAIVAYSGALILDRQGRTEMSIGIDADQALRLDRFIHERWPRVAMTAYAGDEWCVESCQDPWVQEEYRITGAPFDLARIEGFIKDKGIIHKFLCMGEPEVISALADELTNSFQDLAVYRSKPTYLEIMDKAVSKSKAVEYICKK